MSAEVKFSMPIAGLDALRRILRRDFLADIERNSRALEMPEDSPYRVEILRECLRHEHERALIERVLGVDSGKNEIGEAEPPK